MIEAFSSRVARGLTLLPVYRYLMGTASHELQALAARLLDLPGDAVGDRVVGGASGLNSDGAPVQLCITSTAGGFKCRIIADPGSQEPDPSLRIRRASRALRGVLAAAGSQALEPVVETLLEHVVTGDRHRQQRFRHGAMWWAASVEEPGIAVYVDASVDSREGAWRRLDRFLTERFDHAARAKVLIDHFARRCALASIGLEGITPRRSRIKFYANMPADLPDGFLGNLFPPISILASSGCFRHLVADHGLPESEIYLNVGLDGRSGEVQDIKIDANLGLLDLDPERLDEAVNASCRALSIQPIPILKIFDRFAVATSFVGLAVDRHGEKRLNLYLKGACP